MNELKPNRQKNIIGLGWKKQCGSSLGRARYFRIADDVRKRLLLVFVLLCSSATGTAEEIDAVPQVHFNIPQQRADLAVTEFAEQADLTLIVPHDLVQDKEANELIGTYSLQDGIDRLLAGTGLSPSFSNRIVLSISAGETSADQGETMDIKKKAGLLALFAAVFASSATNSQETGSATLEEIVVTARKRVENLQDVPISISAFSGEQIRANGIQRLEYLAPTVPNFHHAQVPTGSDQFYIRGVGSGNNFGFEQAVGQVIDGFYYGRSKIGRAAFLDLERVEVLRGPQGAILGKNNSAGAINLTTAKPTEEFEGSVTATANFDGNDGFGIEGFLTGPLGDNVKGRIAARYDSYDGYIDNIALATDEQSTNDFTVRGTLDWDVSNRVNVMASFQHVSFDRDGHSRELFNCGPVLLGQLAAGGFPVECDLDYQTSVNGPINGVPTQDIFEQDSDFAHLTVNWDFENHTLTSLTGYMNYDFNDFFDGDSTPTENRSFQGIEDYSQILQELRLVTTGDNRVDYTLGAFFLSSDQDTDFLINSAAAGATRVILSNQDSTTMAIFGEVTFHVSDTVDLTIGARYTDEEKEFFQEQFGATVYTTNLVDFPGGFAGNEHVISPVRNEDNISPTLDLQWRPNDSAMFYGSVRRGFKGGGFDMFRNAPQATALALSQFEEEQATAYEIGAKLDLLNNSARLNIALFRSEFDDLQQSVFVSFGTFQVANVASASSQGLEVSYDWQATENLFLKADFAVLNAEYDDYPNGPCYAVQDATTGCTTPNGVRVQNLSGRELQNAPETSGALSATYNWPLSNGMNVNWFVQLVHSGSYAIASDLDPVLFQDSYQTFNTRIALQGADNAWELALIGRNLNDELITVNGSDTSPDSFTAFLLPPRVIGIQGTYRF